MKFNFKRNITAFSIFLILGSPSLLVNSQTPDVPVNVTYYEFNSEILDVTIKIYQNLTNPPPIVTLDFFFENNSYYFSKSYEMTSKSISESINLPVGFNESLDLKIVSNINNLIFRNEFAIPYYISSIQTSLISDTNGTTTAHLPSDYSFLTIFALIIFFFLLFFGIYLVYYYKPQEVDKRYVKEENINFVNQSPESTDLPYQELIHWDQNFKSYEDSLAGKQFNVVNQWELDLIRKYQSESYKNAFKLYLTDLHEQILDLLQSKEKRVWELGEINKITGLPETHLVPILEELFSKYTIDADLNLVNMTINSNYPLKIETESILSYIKKVRDNVPIQISQIAEITQIERENCKIILKELIDRMQIKGEYLELEGIFIKQEITLGEQYIGEFTCQICKSIKHVPSSEVAFCSYCQNPFHRKHLLEWLKTKGTCPICQERIRI